MKYSEAKHGRVFILRLEDKEIVHEVIETFAIEHKIFAASVILLGDIRSGSVLTCGPYDGEANNIKPIERTLDDVHEVAGVGTIFPNSKGEPILHMHTACGRNNDSLTGCIRKGVVVWHVNEVIINELLECTARRLPDSKIGFELLVP